MVDIQKIKIRQNLHTMELTQTMIKKMHKVVQLSKMGMMQQEMIEKEEEGDEEVGVEEETERGIVVPMKMMTVMEEDQQQMYLYLTSSKMIQKRNSMINLRTSKINQQNKIVI